MKLLGIEITRHQVRESFKGFFDTGLSTKKAKKTFYSGQYSWRSRCEKFDKLCEQYRLANQAILTIQGQVIAEGLFHQPVTYREPGSQRDKPYPRSEEALDAIEELDKQLRIETMIGASAGNMAKYGSNFWETTLTPKFDVRNHPEQEAIEPMSQDADGNIDRWKQTARYGGTVAEYTTSDLIHTSWNPSSQTWPYGTSILTGLDVELDGLSDLTSNINAYTEKQAYPYEALQIGDAEYRPTDTEVQTLKSKWKNRQVGENIITTYPTAMIQGGTGTSPIRDLVGLLAFYKENIEDGVMVPSISKLHNATEASAKILASWTSSVLFKPIQRIITEKLENEVYKPYLMDMGFSVKVCPMTLFESPESHKVEDGQFWTSMVNAKIATPQQAAEQLGIEYDEAYWVEQEAKQLEQFKMKTDAAAKSGSVSNGTNPKEEPKKEGKSFKVTELIEDHKHASA
jgi:hypothetical protein